MHDRAATSADRFSGRADDLWRWWLHTGEPATLQCLALAMFIPPTLVILGIAPFEQALRVVLAALWIAAGLLILRLPRLLRSEWRRALTIVLLGAMGLAFMLAGSAGAGLTFGTATVEAAGPLTFKSSPRISREAFSRLLQRGNGAGPSPAAPTADELYDIIVGYGLDPAIALAFFAHESQMGTTGATAAYDLKNWGGTRRATNPAYQRELVRVGGGTFVRYHSWPDGVRDWCELILRRYVNRGLHTVEAAVPYYAPSSDGNVPDAYISNIYRTVGAWQGRSFTRAGRELRSYADSLHIALLKETFTSAGTTFHEQWAFHQFLLSESRAGRPLGSPLDDSHQIEIGGKPYVVQTFALDTLYTPLADDASKTNWSDVRRLSDLLRQTPVP